MSRCDRKQDGLLYSLTDAHWVKTKTTAFLLFFVRQVYLEPEDYVSAATMKIRHTSLLNAMIILGFIWAWRLLLISCSVTISRGVGTDTTTYSAVLCLLSSHYLLQRARVRLYENESGMASTWVHREFNLMSTLSSDKDFRVRWVQMNR